MQYSKLRIRPAVQLPEMQFCISHPHRKHETDLGNPLLKKQTNTKQAQIEFKTTPKKKEETWRK